MKKRKFFDLLVLIEYAFMLLLYIVFNSIETPTVPYSTAIMIAFLANDNSPFFTVIFYILSFVITKDFGLLPASAISGFFLFILTFVYKKLNIKPKYEYSLFAIVSLLGYIFLGDIYVESLIEKRLFCSMLISILTFISHISIKAIKEKGLKIKFGIEEYCSLLALISIFGFGFSNLTNPLIWKGISCLIILVSSYLFSSSKSIIISCMLGLSLSLYYSNINYISAFLVLGLISNCFISFSQYISAILLPFGDYAVYLLFNVYSSYTLYEYLPVIIASCIFAIIPNKPLKNLKEKLYIFREKQLVRQSINQNRLILSNKLFELSGIFNQMASSFNNFNNSLDNPILAKEIMQNKVINNVCKDCENFNKCSKNKQYFYDGIEKMIEIGFAKGKLTLIDIPNEISSICVHPKDIIFGSNKIMENYRNYIIEKTSIYNGRKMIADEVNGISVILKNLALDCGLQLKYQSKIERKLANTLYKNGVLVSELLIYGEGINLTISLIISMKQFAINELEYLISKELNDNFYLADKYIISEEKTYLTFTKSTIYDVAYGISKATKDNSVKSGDTYSATRLNNGKFLIALSDGMGSGENAEKVSDITLSLIESFYKSDMESSLILNTVNKLLAINTEDSYSALDISIVNLETKNADFIKYGSPYTFIISENGIRIVEGNTLPLGILEELKPSICSAELNDNDIILLITDGISDAFKSSSAIIDYLSTIPAKNPQTLTDKILEKAIELNNGEKKDDMSCLALRIYKKPSA